MKIKDLYDQVRDGKIVSDIKLQREIVYNTEKQALVIDSIIKNVPLPAFYFWRNKDDILEVLDGKQRIESIKRFYQNDIQYNDKLWKQTDKKIQEKINNTELSIIICTGEEILKREIFKRINTLGVPLSKYEVLNGLYHGEYLRGLSAFVEQERSVRKILKSNNRGKNQYKILKLLMKLKNQENIDSYVKEKQNVSFTEDQREITKYLKFIADIFESEKQLDIYFDLAMKYIKDVSIWREKKSAINSQITKYLKSDDVKLTNKRKEIEDIINAIVHNISVDPKRLFSSDDKKELLGRVPPNNDNKYKCKMCDDFFYGDELTVDHVKAWSKGGRTELSNAELLCRPCNSRKSNKIIVYVNGE